MRLLGVVAVLCVALTIPACGKDDPASGPAASGHEKPDAIPTEQVIEGLVVKSRPGGSEGAKLVKPLIQPPNPLPEDFLIENLEDGSGPSSKKGDELTLKYVAVNGAGEELYSSWWRRRDEPFTMILGSGLYFRALEEGVKGMKVGGRRAMVIPASLTEDLGALVYVVDLIAVR